MAQHRLTIKGQVTIPKEVRDFLGLREGASRVEFVINADGSVSVKKASEGERAVRALRPARESLARTLAREGWFSTL